MCLVCVRCVRALASTRRRPLCCMDLARRGGLTALDAHVFEGGPSVCCGGCYVCPCFGGAALWRVSRWCEAVDEAVLDRVLGW